MVRQADLFWCVHFKDLVRAYNSQRLRVRPPRHIYFRENIRGLLCVKALPENYTKYTTVGLKEDCFLSLAYTD